jgi:hypothetical protein
VDSTPVSRALESAGFGPDIMFGGFSITVKEVVGTLEMAQSEVRRLNELNGGLGCRYFWQQTRNCSGL